VADVVLHGDTTVIDRLKVAAAAAVFDHRPACHDAAPLASPTVRVPAARTTMWNRTRGKKGERRRQPCYRPTSVLSGTAGVGPGGRFEALPARRARPEARRRSVEVGVPSPRSRGSPADAWRVQITMAWRSPRWAARRACEGVVVVRISSCTRALDGLIVLRR
jgi:hypothetical protein